MTTEIITESVYKGPMFQQAFSVDVQELATFKELYPVRLLLLDLIVDRPFGMLI